MPYIYIYIYGVVSEGFFAESLRKFCAKFAEKKLLRQERPQCFFDYKHRFIASGKAPKFFF